MGTRGRDHSCNISIPVDSVADFNTPGKRRNQLFCHSIGKRENHSNRIRAELLIELTAVRMVAAIIIPVNKSNIPSHLRAQH